MGISSAGFKTLRVAFIDIFGKNKGVAMGQCFRKDYTHGELTSGVLRHLTQKAKPQIDLFPVKPRAGSGKMSFDGKSLLKQLKRVNSSDQHYDYVNISSSFVRPYELVEGATAENLSDPAIQRAFYEQLPEQVKHIIAEIEQLTSNGTNVYISACNKKTGFNALSLAKGVRTVSGKNALTGEPIRRFSVNSLVSGYQPLPVYMTTSEQVQRTAPIRALKMSDLVSPVGDYAGLSHFELRRKIASKKDYEELGRIVEDLYGQGKFVFDLDFMRFKLPSVVKNRGLQGRIFEIDKFKEIFNGKFSPEIMEYTFPRGTHCDLSFRQFFDMKNKSRCIMPITQTTKIPNTASGTSFAAPQALAQDLMRQYYA